jgi:large subunit ribosomal protein L23
MEVLLKPLITEKMTANGELYNQYGFVVRRDAKKSEIKDAVEKTYDVSVERVNTNIFPGKPKSRYSKTGILTGRTQSYKKAVVTLKDGDIIDFYSNL